MKNVFILVIALGMAFGVTIPKLYKMCQIKGWLPGANATNEIITQKWNQTPAEHPSGRDTYWIAWTDDDIRKVGEHRVNVPPEHWNHLNLGDQIEVVRLSGDGWAYLRDDIFVSVGNFAFDGILLVAEIGVAFAMLVGLNRNRNPTTNAT